MEGEDSSSSSVLVVEDGDGLDAAAGERDEPVADVGVGGECMTGVEGETGDAGTCVAAEYAVDGRGGRTVGEGEGEPGEGLPSAAPGVGDRGGAHGVAEVEARQDVVLQVFREGGQKVHRRRRRRIHLPGLATAVNSVKKESEAFNSRRPGLFQPYFSRAEAIEIERDELGLSNWGQHGLGIKFKKMFI